MLGRGGTYWPFKLVIALAWLVVPLSAWLLVRSDFEHYQQDCLAQRADCEKRSALIASQTKSLANWARRIDALATHEDYVHWARHMQFIEEWYTADAAKLRLTAPMYYPRLDAMLLAVTGDLLEQQELLKDAALNQDGYVNTAEEYNKLLKKLSQAQARVQFFKDRDLAEQYAESLQDLRQVYTEYDLQTNARAGMFARCLEAQDGADKLHQAILQRLARFDSLASQDEQRTYAGMLKLRLARFSLREVLRKLAWG